MKAPLPTIKRAPGYLRLLTEYQEKKTEWVSATDIAMKLKLTPIQVRKDLSLTGIVGTAKKGFQVNELIESLRKFLGWNSNSEAFLIGAGALGSALMGYKGFEENGLKIVAAFDSNPAKIGTKIHGTKIIDIKQLKDLVIRMKILIGIITVPAEFAQKTAEILVDAGIKGIWNFSPVKLKLPENIIVQKEDLSSGFAVLSAKISKLN